MRVFVALGSDEGPGDAPGSGRVGGLDGVVGSTLQTEPIQTTLITVAFGDRIISRLMDCF